MFGSKDHTSLGMQLPFFSDDPEVCLQQVLYDAKRGKLSSMRCDVRGPAPFGQLNKETKKIRVLSNFKYSETYTGIVLLFCKRAYSRKAIISNIYYCQTVCLN